MFARVRDSLTFTRGERSFVVAYAAVMAMTAGIAMLIMGNVEEGAATVSSAQLLWIIAAGAAAGGVSLFAARGWMGQPRVLGFARAFVGCLVIAFLASLIAGTLIRPLYGTFYAPVLVVDAFISMPWLAALWFGILMGAHYLLAQLNEERALGIGRSPRRATAELSRLSQTNLYSRHYRG